MEKRPLSVTIICWFLIVSALLSSLMIVPMLNAPEGTEIMARFALPLNVQIGLMIVGLLVSVGSAIAMLKGKKLGRTVYLGWSVVSIIIGLVNSPSVVMIIPSVIVMGLIAFFLLTRKANAYFAADVS